MALSNSILYNFSIFGSPTFIQHSESKLEKSLTLKLFFSVSDSSPQFKLIA